MQKEDFEQIEKYLNESRKRADEAYQFANDALQYALGAVPYRPSKKDNEFILGLEIRVNNAQGEACAMRWMWKELCERIGKDWEEEL